jgi:hypothetical protein
MRQSSRRWRGGAAPSPRGLRCAAARHQSNGPSRPCSPCSSGLGRRIGLVAQVGGGRHPGAGAGGRAMRALFGHGLGHHAGRPHTPRRQAAHAQRQLGRRPGHDEVGDGLPQPCCAVQRSRGPGRRGPAAHGPQARPPSRASSRWLDLATVDGVAVAGHRRHPATSRAPAAAAAARQGAALAPARPAPHQQHSSPGAPAPGLHPVPRTGQHGQPASPCGTLAQAGAGPPPGPCARAARRLQAAPRMARNAGPNPRLVDETRDIATILPPPAQEPGP